MCKLFPSICHPIKDPTPLHRNKSATTVLGKLRLQKPNNGKQSILHMKETMLWKSIEKANLSFFMHYC